VASWGKGRLKPFIRTERERYGLLALGNWNKVTGNMLGMADESLLERYRTV
jgi:hypothetical protein